MTVHPSRALLVAALVLLVLAALGAAIDLTDLGLELRIDLGWLGLACFVGAEIAVGRE